MRLFFALMVLLYHCYGFGYSTDCEIRDGRAYGYAISGENQELTIDGDVKFIFFDEDGDEIDDDTTHEFASLHDEREEIEDVRADNDAKSCLFDISRAVQIQGIQRINGDVIGFCQIEDDKAKIFVKTAKNQDIKIDGEYAIHFFDEDGDKVDDDSININEDIDEDEIELIDEINVRDDDAVSCSLDLSTAL